MDKKALSKKVIAGAVILGAFVGAVWGAASYWTGGAFQPGENDRALRNNQVLFDDQKNNLSQEGSDNGDSFWEDRDALDKVSDNQQPGYLFSADETVPEATTAGIVGPDTGSAGTDRPSTGIDITTRPGGTTGTVTGGTTSGGSTGGTTGGTTTPTTPSATITGDGTISNPYQGGSVIQDPDSEKDPPADPYYPPPTHITDDTGLSDPDDYYCYIGKPFSTIASLLYKSETVDTRVLFNALDTYVEDGNYNRYYWTAADLGKTFRIDKISFDGIHWINMTDETTVTIPTEAANAYLQVSYRFRQKDDWTSYVSDSGDPFVEYELEESRVFLLNTMLPANKKLTSAMLLNFDKNDQHIALGEKANLTYFLDNLMQLREKTSVIGGSKPLKTLFPGFMEDGKTVPWRYSVTTGRHVLEAPPNVSFDTGTYEIKIVQYWMMDDYSYGDQGDGKSLSYLQTLVRYKGKTDAGVLSKLRAPQYTQAIDLSSSQALIVDTVVLPNTVLYINTDGIPESDGTPLGLQVEKAYEVEAGNPRYTSGDGLLYNLDGTEILGVPVSKTSLTVSESITSVHLPYQSKLDTLTLQAKDPDALPEINLERLNKDCKLLVDESILEDYLASRADQLSAAGLYVASTQNPETAYTVRDGLVLRRDETLHRVLDTNSRWLSIPNTVTGMEAGCLTGLNETTMIQLPSDGSCPILEKDCFGGASALKTILCYSQAQYEAAKAAAPEGVQVVLANIKEVNGYRYMDTGNGQIMLLSVPSDITEFDGTVPGPDGSAVTVASIGSNTFAGCTSLRWVDLPEETTAIGQSAFQDCTSLEGVVIGAKSVMLGQDAFQGCTQLRFIASNAMECDLGCPDLALPCDTASLSAYSYLFCLEGAEGYNGNWICFDKSEVTGFRLVDCGGTKVLYGLLDDSLWFALRSGSSLDGDVSMPASTETIGRSAFQNTSGPNGDPFQVNWSQLTSLGVIGDYAFYGSDLGPRAALPPELSIGTSTFSYCSKLTHMTIPGDEGQIRLGYSTFEYDTALESVNFGAIDTDSGLLIGSFNGCGKLRELTFHGDPALLTTYRTGFGFRFNYDSDYDEAQNLRVIVPEELKEQYVERWRYGFAGYMSISPQDDYQKMWSSIQSELLGSPDYSNEAVTKRVDQLLLEAENYVRTLLGMKKVTTATHRYQYTVTDGSVTLVGARNVGYTELTANVMDMPSGWTLDYIGAGAFSQSPELYQVRLPGTLSGIYSGAFTGVQCVNGPLDIDISGNVPPELLGFSPDAPFAFGIDDENVRIHPYGCDTDAVLKRWLLPMTGYSSVTELHDAMAASLADGTDEAVKNAMLEKLIAGENRLRVMLELDPISDPAELLGVTEEEIQATFQTIQETAQPDAREPVITDSIPETEPTETAPADPQETEPVENPGETESAETEPTEVPPETEPAETSEPTEASPGTLEDKTLPEESEPPAGAASEP